MPIVQLNHLELFYEKMGVGEPVIFLHSGYSRGILAFASQILDFQRNYTCFLPDFRGHGRTRCESLEWSTPQITDDIVGLIENGKQETINQMIERHKEAHNGNWQEFMRQSAQDWRLYPQLTEEQIRSITCPALFITGEHDPFVGEEKIKRLVTLVKGSRYVVIPNGSHRPHMLRENPTLVNDTIFQFLANPVNADLV
jgi:pimeloyl-ACP methyl ester carboxylesterase